MSIYFMDNNLKQIKEQVYDKCALELKDFKLEIESKEYNACLFKLNNSNVICRSSKMTPKKVGQFVTFWKRNHNGPIEPFNDKDKIDFLVINVRSDSRFGQFVFPKSILIKKGIISTDKKEGKRAFRVYSSWDVTNNKQAKKSQQWQLDYFYEINMELDIQKINKLYQLNE